MSYECLKPRCSIVAALTSASLIVRPATNCSPSMRMARSTLLRISASPPRAIRRVRTADRDCSPVADASFPVSANPQVAALTNSDSLCPKCARQSPGATLSRMSASRVASSGIRSSASARHIKATPSAEESEYSCISAATPERESDARRPSTRARATRLARASAAAGSDASANRGPTQSVSARL